MQGRGVRESEACQAAGTVGTEPSVSFTPPSMNQTLTWRVGPQWHSVRYLRCNV